MLIIIVIKIIIIYYIFSHINNILYLTEKCRYLLYFPQAIISPLQGTYLLLWINFGAYLRSDEIRSFMQENVNWLLITAIGLAVKTRSPMK